LRYGPVRLQDHRAYELLDKVPQFRRCSGCGQRLAGLVQRPPHRLGQPIRILAGLCRDHRREERSLDDWVPDEGDGCEGDTWTTFGKTITEEEAHAHIGHKRSPQEQAELALDIAMVLRQLSDEDRQLCLLLQVNTPLELSRDKGLCRSSIYERIKAIRHKFIEAGIHRGF
jgi:hypothetical protein